MRIIGLMFEKIIEDLIETGLTESAIGLKVGATQPTINRIRNGKQYPLYDLGKALTDLHKKAMAAKKRKAA